MHKSASLLGRFVPLPLFAILYYVAKLKRFPKLVNPTTYNDFMLRKKLHDRNPLIPETGDKFTLRSYVKERLGNTDHLPALHQAVSHVDELRIEDLPTSYVMKASHASGWLRLVENSNITTDEIKALTSSWLKRSYYWRRKEWAYSQMTPRVVFEEHLSVGMPPPMDYKLYVFNGVPQLIEVHTDRFSKQHRRAYFDQSWNLIDLVFKYPAAEKIDRPKHLQLMLEISSLLAQPFDFVRVDLYYHLGKVLVGELTHYPTGGVSAFDPPIYDVLLGELWSGKSRTFSADAPQKLTD